MWASETYTPKGSNLGESIPHPVRAKRRYYRSILPFGIRESRRPEETARVAILAHVALLMILLGAVCYAFTISSRMGNMQRLLTDPNAHLPPIAAKQLHQIAQKQYRDSMASAESRIAEEVSRITRDLLSSKLHKFSSEIAQGVAENIQQRMADWESEAAAAQIAVEAAARAPLTLEDFPSYIPYDLRFDPSNVKEFIQTNLDMVSKDMHPSTYDGPLDMEEQITLRAQELQEEWIAAGSPKTQVPGFRIANPERYPPFPFRKVKARGQDTGIIVVSAPFADEYYLGADERGEYWRLKNSGNIMIGMTAYQQFPREILNPGDERHTSRNPSDKAIYDSIEAWLHGFRDPDAHLPEGKPRALIAAGDYINFNTGVLKPSDREKKYDFIINMGGEQWNDYTGNFTLTSACIRVMNDMDMKVLLVTEIRRGVEGGAAPPMNPTLEIFTNMTNVDIQSATLHDYYRLLDSARAIFVPGGSEACYSPVTDALSLNVPALMHTNDEMGGWKYINEQTGVLFSDENDVRAAIQRLFSPEYQARLAPRQWFVDHWGQETAALRLQAFMELVVGKERLAEARTTTQSNKSK